MVTDSQQEAMLDLRDDLSNLRQTIEGYIAQGDPIDLNDVVEYNNVLEAIEALKEEIGYDY